MTVRLGLGRLPFYGLVSEGIFFEVLDDLLDVRVPEELVRIDDSLAGRGRRRNTFARRG